MHFKILTSLHFFYYLDPYNTAESYGSIFYGILAIKRFEARVVESKHNMLLVVVCLAMTPT